MLYFMFYEVNSYETNIYQILNQKRANQLTANIYHGFASKNCFPAPLMVLVFNIWSDDNRIHSRNILNVHLLGPLKDGHIFNGCCWPFKGTIRTFCDCQLAWKQYSQVQCTQYTQTTHFFLIIDGNKGKLSDLFFLDTVS